MPCGNSNFSFTFGEMKKKNLCRGIIKVSLAALFAFYYISITFFFHTHTIDGATISHSHIHSNSHHDTKSGNHTEQSIILIAQSSYFEYIDFLCNYVLIPPQFTLHKNKFIRSIHWITPIHLENLSLRAPPVV